MASNPLSPKPTPMALAVRRALLLSLVIFAVAALVSGAMLVHGRQLARLKRTYERQLSGALSAREEELQRLDANLRKAQSKLVDQEALEREYNQYKNQLGASTAALDHFKKMHDLEVRALLQTLNVLEQRITGGHVTVKEHPGEERPGGSRPRISYEYVDPDERLHLRDPDIDTPGDETLTLVQSFRVTGVLFEEKQGSLMSQHVQLTEVKQQAEGTWRELAAARLVDASFTYSHPPRPTPRQGTSGWELSPMLTVGTSFRTERPVLVGCALNVVRLRGFGLGAGAATDLNSLEGTGAQVLLTFRPSLGDQRLNVALGGGLVLPFGGKSRVRPTLTASFILF